MKKDDQLRIIGIMALIAVLVFSLALLAITILFTVLK